MAVQQFIEAMFANGKTSIITFASSAKGVCLLTSDKDLLNKNAKFYSSGGTNTNAAINIALQQLVGVSGNKSIILMSDCDDNVSDDNLEKAQTNDIKIHAVALGQGANSFALKKYAKKTYGEFFIVKKADELKSIYYKLSAENQFNFGNLPDSDGDGVPDDIGISGVPMPSGKLVFLDPTNPDTDGDGLSDGDEVGKLSRNYAPSDVPDCAVTYKFSFDVTSDPTMVDSDEDGILDPFDDHPFDAIPPRVKEIIDFFDGAELFEIKYILDKMYVLIDDKGDLDSIETAIKIIKIFREYKGTSNPRGLIQRMLDEGVYGRDGWIAFWDTIFPQMSVPAVWLSEYELYSNGTSFADLTQTAYEQWSSSAKCAAIWLFGVSSDFGKALAEYGYSPEYTFSLQQEQTIRKYVEFSKQYVYANNYNKYGINPTQLKLSGTVENNAVKYLYKSEKTIQIGDGFITIHYVGESQRPFVKYGTSLIMNEIMEAGTPIPDPQGVPGVLRYGTEGIWELAINTNNNTVLHFNFTTSGGK